MRRPVTRTLLLVAAACWLSAGPGGVTVQAIMACQHRQAHQSHAGHAGVPSDAPCFCEEMTGGSTLAVSPAVPAVLPGAPVISRPVRARSYPSRFPLPPSPSLAPESPPPNGLV